MIQSRGYVSSLQRPVYGCLRVYNDGSIRLCFLLGIDFAAVYSVIFYESIYIRDRRESFAQHPA